MKHLISYFLFLIIMLSSSPSMAEARGDVDAVLNELDGVINNKKSYHEQLEQRMLAIKTQIDATADQSRKCELYKELYDGYLHFQADSALKFANVRSKICASSDNRQLKYQIIINRAEVYGVMGMYNETLQELEKIPVTQLDLDTRGYYYRTYRAYYGWVADYTALESAKAKYLRLADTYRDSVMMFEPLEVNRNMSEVERLINQDRLDEAIEELAVIAELTDDNKQQAYIHYNFSQIYLKKGDTQSAIYYLAKTAIVDIMMGTREYASLQHLAYVLYQQGELNRAYQYLNCSMEDAVDSNARLRFMEVTKYYPIIDRAYRNKDDMHQKTAYTLLLCVSLFAITLIILSIYLFVSRRRISAMRSNLYDTNQSLVTLNLRMAEMGRIKEVYIARYLERCVTYINKLDTYRRSLKRLASASKTEELLKVLKSEQMLQRERKEFYVEFDHSFLTLFPNFVNDFNMLLNEKDQMRLKSEGQLNTELRIFALIRLGITDATQIAHFLGYSLATVYSYRSKIRNRAIIDKDIFEQRVMEL